ncbi:MAG: dTMP kinase [Woeseiaceae bacterium]|nr:dTMP kinase [Woeseiaceae bacterium]NIP20377.1 dTMP kinase [Woeseiaceae bacterium]NIS89267.1 dTMP kinase [Woeseiaceae bacterium]
METGKFITFEGIEGVGKSTNIGHFVTAVEAAGHEVLVTREPGGTPTAERIRDLLAEHGSEAMPEVAELLLVFAARAIHVDNLIRPALQQGTWVVSDRFTDSSRAYQGGGRGLPQEDINRLADWVHGDLEPDLTILLDAPVETGMERAGDRGDPDRFESEDPGFFRRVRDTYLQLAQAQPERFVVVDATQGLEAVQSAIESIAHQIINSIK